MRITRMLLMTGATLLPAFWFGMQADCARDPIHTDANAHTDAKDIFLDHVLSVPAKTTPLRYRRQLLFRKKRKQSTFLSALNRLVLDTVNDTSIAYRNISSILSDQFGGRNATQVQMSNNGTTTGSSNRTSPIFSMQQLFDLLGRNYRGLVKLFNSEIRTAITDSNRNVARYRKEFRDAVKPFFLSNRNVSSNTT